MSSMLSNYAQQVKYMLNITNKLKKMQEDNAKIRRDRIYNQINGVWCFLKEALCLL